MTDVVSPGDVVQVTTSLRPAFVGAFLMVSEVKSWGVQGFIHHVESFEESKQIWLRVPHGEYALVGYAVVQPANLTEGES